MKKKIILFALMINYILVVEAQMISGSQTPYIGQHAPSFKAQATTGNINFPDDFFTKWKILFSHPADFTPVCTSEIMALAEKQENFKKLNTALIVISTDGLNSHIEWVKSIESISIVGKENVKINFPLVSDVSTEISKKYNLLRKDTILRKDLRAVIFIDPDNKIRAILNYPDNIGRNTDEIERILIALQTADNNEVLTPANWKPGKDVLIPSPKTMEESDNLKAKNKSGYYSLAWYLWYRKL
jgi:peroxiredoxin (alkyl hydroperoxide reductase subunit C)